MLFISLKPIQAEQVRDEAELVSSLSVLWQHPQQQSLRRLLLLRQLHRPLVHEGLERVGVLLHDRQHVVEYVRTPATTIWSCTINV